MAKKTISLKKKESAGAPPGKEAAAAPSQEAPDKKEEKSVSGKVSKENKEAPPEDNHRNVTSITRKLHFYQIRKLTGLYVRLDALVFVIAPLFFLLGQEMALLGGFVWNRPRHLSRADGGELMYLVGDGAGNSLLEVPMGEFLRVLGIGLIILFAVQFLFLWLGYFGEDIRIRRILRPLDRLALRADELSRMSFSEDKYQALEEAITHIQPDAAESLSLGDSDLMGVETAMNNLIRRMRDTYRQQARFVNDASHELRTPIAVIQGYANMLDRWGKKDSRVLDESIAAIRHEADHMNRLVEQLLFLARGDSGRTVLKVKSLDLKEFLQEIYEESFMIDEKHVYRMEENEEKIAIRADDGLLKQAVRILVDNAAKYTRDGNEIFLSYGRIEDGSSFIQVQDTGIGMAEEDVPRMFDRFFRADDVRSYDGTGLGLSIAKWIVDKHKGRFDILSRQGLGTRIRIVLPQNVL